MKTKKLPQKEDVRRHLKRYKKITSWTAFKKYGITRLAAIIPRLRDDGMKIEPKPGYGKKSKFTIYVIK